MFDSTLSPAVVQAPAASRNLGPCRIVWNKPDAWSSFTPLRYDSTSDTLKVYTNATEDAIMRRHTYFEAPWHVEQEALGAFGHDCPAARFGLPRNTWATLLLELQHRPEAVYEAPSPTPEVQAIQALGYELHIPVFPLLRLGSYAIQPISRQAILIGDDLEAAARGLLNALQTAAV